MISQTAENLIGSEDILELLVDGTDDGQLLLSADLDFLELGAQLLLGSLDASCTLDLSSALASLGSAFLDDSVGVDTSQGTEVGDKVDFSDGEATVVLGAGELVDLIGGNEATKVGVGHHRAGDLEALLVLAVLGDSTKDAVQSVESTLGPDAESAKVTSRGESKETKASDIDELNTRKISEGLSKTIVLLVDDERTTLLNVSSISHFTLTGSESAGSLDLSNITVDVKFLEDGDGFLGLLDLLNVILDDNGELVGLVNLVTTGHDKGRKTGGGNGGSGGHSSHVKVDLSMPSSPDLGGGKESTSTAHVTEGTLSRSVGTTTTDSGDTGDGTAGTV